MITLLKKLQITKILINNKKNAKSEKVLIYIKMR